MENNATCPIKKWLISWTQENFMSKDRVIELLGQMILILFRRWCTENGVTYEVSTQAFGLRQTNGFVWDIQRTSH